MASALDSLISSKSSDSGLQIQLHPLALLCIAEHITRHVARNRPGPIVGSLLGSQDGRIISLVNAHDIRITTSENGEDVIDDDWFTTRLEQYKEVYKNPPLELVGWYTIASESGPSHQILPIHHHILEKYNQDAVLLTFQPAQMLDPGKQAAGKLPVRVYESVWEDEQAGARSAVSTASEKQAKMHLRLRELPYSIETDDTEMIAINTLSSGGDGASQEQSMSDSSQGLSKSLNQGPTLTREEEDMISGLQTRLGAIRTLNSRLGLITAYLQSISPNLQGETSDSSQGTSRQLLRQIHSLISDLSLANPTDDSDPLRPTSSVRSNDADVLEILSRLCQHMSDLQSVAKDHASFEELQKRGTMGTKSSATHKIFIKRRPF